MPLTILFFLAGIVTAQQFTVLPSMFWLIPIMFVAAVFGWKKHYSIVAFLLGVVWVMLIANDRLTQRLPENLAGQDVLLQGYIADLSEVNSDLIRFNFKITKELSALPKLVRLTWYHPEQLPKAGQSWQLTARLKPPHGNLNPGGFDYERWLFVEGIGATGYIRAEPKPRLIADQAGLSAVLLTWRQHLADQIDALKVNPDSLGMIKALTIGEGGSLSQQQWEVFRRTGTTHLMVISGSHVALIAGLTYWLALKLLGFTRLGTHAPRQLAALLSVLSGFFYAGLTGFAVPAQRAALMLAIAMLALAQRRHIRAFYSFGLALLAVLVLEPLVVLQPGFWLSFAAVALIIYVISGRVHKLGFVLGTIKINWATAIGLAPLLLYFFQQVSVIAPLVNLIVVPIIGLIIVPLALLATLMLLIAPTVGYTLFVIIDYCLQGVWWWLARFAELPMTTFIQIQPSGWALSLAVLGVLLLLAPKGLPLRWLGVVLALPVLVTKNQQPSLGEAQLTLLDVGQGLSAVVQTANHVLVYDTGAKFSEHSNAGQSIVLPFLRSQGLNKLDTLVVSHGDNDHIGGAKSILTEFKTGQIYTSVPHMLADFSPVPCQAGQSWQWDGVSFAVLSPKLGEFSSDNDNSCVLQVRSQTSTMLLPGDIEAEAETQLVKHYGAELRSDVLIAPHHGSRTSSTTAFLQAVNPRIILIPAGYRNQFSHPHDEVLRQYQTFHQAWLVSASTGALKVTTQPSFRVTAYRVEQGHYWNHRN